MDISDSRAHPLRWVVMFLAGGIFWLHSSAASAEILAVQDCPNPFDVTAGPATLLLINETTGRARVAATSSHCYWNGLAQRGTGDFYATVVECAAGSFGSMRLIKVNRATLSAEVIGTLVDDHGNNMCSWSISSGVRGLAFSPDGNTLYAVVDEMGEDDTGHFGHRGTALYTIDPGTAVATRIGPTNAGGSGVDYVIALTFAAQQGGEPKLYGFIDVGRLVEIDTRTGAGRRIGEPLGAPEFESLTSLPDRTSYQLLGVSRGRLYKIDATTGDYYEAIRFPGAIALPSGIYAIQYVRGSLAIAGSEVHTGPLWLHRNLFLADCWGCVNCFPLGRICDPRVNKARDRFFVLDPGPEGPAVFSRRALGLTEKDGVLQAAAPLADGKQTLYIATAPLADRTHRNSGSVLIFDRSGKMISRVDGQAADERLGTDMDVKGGSAAVVSNREMLRFRRGELIARLRLDKEMKAGRGIFVRFVPDADGDGQAEIELTAPYAPALKAAGKRGVIQVVGSKSGAVIKTVEGTSPNSNIGTRRRQTIGSGKSPK